MTHPPRTLTLAACIAATAGAATAQSAADLFEASGVTFLDANHRLELPADLDGDGHLELVGWWSYWSSYSSIEVFFWTQDPASGAWSEERKAFGSGSSSYNGGHDTVVGDFDGDGRDEMLVLHRSKIEVFEPDASGRPARILQQTPFPALTGSVREALVIDFDGDGLDDVVVADGARVRLYRSSVPSGGGLVLTATDELPSYGGELRLAAVDLTGSPTPELLLLQDHGAPMLWTLSVEGGVFGAAVRNPCRPTTNGERIDLVPGDLDLDGDTDLVLFGHDGRFEVIRNDGGVLTMEADRVGGPATALADLDGDGDLDGICCGSGGGNFVYNTAPSTFHLALNRGGGDFEPAVAFPGLGAHHVAGALDHDGDGDVDVLAGRVVLLNRQEIGSTFCAATVNSSGAVGRIFADGRASVSAGGPHIRATELPTGTTCVLLASPSQDTASVAPWSFWDGTLCIRPFQLRRLRIASADAAGTVDLGGIPQWTTGGWNTGAEPGMAFGYQVWFRDVTSSGTGANVTDATRILLTN